MAKLRVKLVNEEDVSKEDENKVVFVETRLPRIVTALPDPITYPGMALFEGLRNPTKTVKKIKNRGGKAGNKKKQQRFIPLSCKGCEMRSSGRMVGGAAITLSDDKCWKNALSDMCAKCRELNTQIHEHMRTFFQGLERNEPDPVIQMYRRYPPWGKYILRGIPETAVRIVSMMFMLESSVLEAYSKSDEIESTATDLARWSSQFKMLVSGALVDLSRHLACVAGPLILEYVDPSIFWMMVLRLDDSYTTKDKTSLSGFTLIPRISPDCLERVDGWSDSVANQLKKIPLDHAFLFCAPVGFLPLREHVQRFLNPLFRSTDCG